VRQDPPPTGPELEQLTAFLDLQRETVLLKAEGLDAEGLRRPLPPSSLTLGGLLNHLALVEDHWFGERFAGLPEQEIWAGVDWAADPDFEFRTAADHAPDELRQRYRDACARSREVVARAAGADQLAAQARPDGTRWDLRWVLLHMIEETARHAGHADLLREAVDGQVGD
jgi:uncharacterized damage-inducible protein DinB